MAEGIRELCALSLLFGVCMSMTPEGGVKRVMSILCSAILILSVLTPLSRLDLDACLYKLENYRERGEELHIQGSEMQTQLDRHVIEEQCEAYIMDKAKINGLILDSAEVETHWSSDELWLPYSVQLYGCPDSKGRQTLSRLIARDLGIPIERQMWIELEK